MRRPMDEWKAQRAAVSAALGVHRGAAGASTPRLTADAASILESYWRAPLSWVGVAFPVSPPATGTLEADRSAWLSWGKRASAIDVELDSPALPELRLPFGSAADRAVESVAQTARDAAEVTSAAADAAGDAVTAVLWRALKPALWVAGGAAVLGGAWWYLSPKTARAAAQKAERAALKRLA